MTPAPRFAFRAWPIALLLAVGFLVWVDVRRARHVDQVTHTDATDARVDPQSPTGYADGKRWLIVPEHNNRSYGWIAQTQQMFAQHEWRVRRIDSENAPFGSEVHAASPYRWWLGFVAWCDHTISGRPIGLSVERTALWADPLLHLLLLIGTTVFVARVFGDFSAVLTSIGLVALFPFAGGFLPGAPDDQNLSRAIFLWSALLLVAGIAREGARPKRWFILAGIAGGLGLWINASAQVLVLGSLALGGIAASWIAVGSKQPSKTQRTLELLPWRAWAFAGATTSLVACLIEYFPSHLTMHLEVNHPLYGLAWIGAGELLVQIEERLKRGSAAWNLRRGFLSVVALLAVAALPVALIVTKTPSVLADPAASRLTFLPNGAVAKNFSAWIARDGFSGMSVATLLPLLLLGLSLGMFVRTDRADVSRRGALILAATLPIVLLVLACWRLAWWNAFDIAVLALVAAAASGTALKIARPLWGCIAAIAFFPGMIQLRPPTDRDVQPAFTPLEIEGLTERAIAHALTDRAGAGHAIVLLPPDRTASWSFHGGFRGIGSERPENRAGLAATIRIVSATTVEEAQAMINERGVTHLVLLSWNPDLEEFVRWGVKNPDDAFIAGLHHWSLPPWLRPIPYNLPAGTGFEGQSVAIFEVIDETSRALSLSRLAEYFVETQRLDQAATAATALERYPTDLGALIARAQVEKAREDTAAFEKTVRALVSSLENGLDRSLGWDRRVSLAIVLAQGGRTDLARKQITLCLEKIDANRVRSLTTASLLRLQVLIKAFGLQISDPGLRDLARQLTPPELRAPP